MSTENMQQKSTTNPVEDLLRALRAFGLAAAFVAAVAPLAPAASLVEVAGFGSNPGNLEMFKYVPDGMPANAPLVVVLHGCTQSASSYDEGSGWTKFADRWKFALALPQQRPENNGSLCFRWFELAHTARDKGEALSIRQMVDKMVADHSVDMSRVYVTGLSAGGAMTAVMLSTYPDLFKGGAVVAGIPYRCASTIFSALGAFVCLNGIDLTPGQWGDKVRDASSHSGPWPKVSLWQGTSDTTVRPMNMTELMEQWTDVHGVDRVADIEETVKGYPHKVYKDAAGNAVVETYSITGMQHGAPIDPGTAPR